MRGRYMLVCVLFFFSFFYVLFFFLMIRRPPRSTLDRSSAASDVYKRQVWTIKIQHLEGDGHPAESTLPIDAGAEWIVTQFAGAIAAASGARNQNH